jgi:hypothetical protein
VRLELLIATAFAVLAPGAVTTAQVPIPPDGIPGGSPIPAAGAATAAQREEETLVLESRLIHPGLSLAERDQGVFGISLDAKVVKNRFGRGTLELEPNPPTFDEFGFRKTNSILPPVKLECTMNLVKTRTFQRSYQRGVEDVSHEEEWLLYKIQAPKITSRLFLAMRAKSPYGPAYRLLVHDKDGKVRYAVDVATPLIQPCHPGCFPANTAIHVPGGTKQIERVREGDLVTTVDPDGVSSPGKVATVFVSRNRVLEVRTEAGSLLTTETQPFCLAAGGLRAAGELKPGDRICCWDGGKRRAAAVQSVSASGREQSVFNLILGDPAIFVADGFLVRSKPAAPAAPGRTEGVVP